MLPFELPASGGYLVALSGGADSRLLLELTVRAVLARNGNERIMAAHLNHGIRGEEADRDEAFCRRVCMELGVPLCVDRIDIPAMARASGQSEETAAREARYAFFVRVMKENGIPALLTAHNADDQLETILFHLLRGSGTRGMIGIPAERSLGDTLPNGTPLTVYRPILRYSRKEILRQISEWGLDYVTDSTNLTETCTRNRFRHRIVPLLEEISAAGAPQEAAVRLGQAAREDEDALMSMAIKQYVAAKTPNGLTISTLTTAPPAIAKRMIRLSYAEYLGAAPSADRTLAARHLDAILALCRAEKDGAVSDALPGHVRAEIRRGHLTFSLCHAVKSKPAQASMPLCPLEPGRTVWIENDPRITIDIETVDLPIPSNTDETIFASACFPASLALMLTARTREPGDTILSHGMNKKLKKLICDNHIPIDLRDCLPLICLSDGTPLWFPGAGFRDGFPAPACGSALRVTIRIQTN